MKRLLFVFTIFLFLLQIPVFAYDSSAVKHDTDVWILDDNYKGDCTVIVLLALDPSSAKEGTLQFYDFFAESADFDGQETAYGMQYEYRFEKNKVIHETDSMAIVTKQFHVDPGTYCFGDMGSSHPVTLPDGMNVTNCDFNELNDKMTVSMQSGDTYTVYAMTGDYSWVKENMSDFVTFACGRDASYNPSDYKQDEKETVSVSENEILSQIEEVIKDVDVTIEEEETVDKPQEEKKKENTIIDVKKMIACIAVLVILAGIAFFRKLNKED